MEYVVNLNILAPLVVSFGAFQGIILSMLLGISSKYKFKPARFFALLLLSISAVNIYGAFDLVEVASTPLFEDYVPYFWVDLIPVSVYFFVTYLIDRNYAFTRKDSLFFVPAALSAGYQFYHFFQYLRWGPYDPQAYHAFNLTGNFFELFSSGFSVVVFLICIKKLTAFQKQLMDFYSDVESANLSWALRFLYIGLFIATCWVVVSFVNIYPGYFIKPLAIFTWLSITGLIYWTGASLLFRKSLLSRLPALSDINPGSISPKEHTVCEFEEIGHVLQEHLHKHQPFLDADLTLRDLAKQMGTTDKKLSTYLNQHLSLNFSDFINGLRIETFKTRVQQGELANYSIVGLAKTCGFKSKSSFYRSFKKLTGTTPSEYLGQLTKKAS
ncbi:MAG: helix-turn-helix transcriptional regulator [Bacteroidota bacterium]